MDAIDTLMAEHRKIERVLDALELFINNDLRGTADDRTELGRFIRVIREFADAKHHGKEEDVLFDAMMAAGFPRQAGPVAVMLHEHDIGRGLVAEMASAQEAQHPWMEQTLRSLRSAAHEFASMLRAHIQKEDQILYPMAKQRLAGADYELVCKRCAERDLETDPSGSVENLADELLRSYA